MLSKNNIKDIYPLSPLQEGIYFHSKLEGDSSAYMEQLRLNLVGDLDEIALRKAIAILIQRHDALRTVFVNDKNGRPLQVVLKNREVDFQQLDISDLSPANQEEVIAAFLVKDYAHKFDLGTDRLIRFTLFKKDSFNCCLILTHYHLIMDGFCSRIIMDELRYAYQCLVDKVDVRLSPAPQYAEYIKWLSEQSNSDGLGYWSTYLSGYYAEHPSLNIISYKSPLGKEYSFKSIQCSDIAKEPILNFCSALAVTPYTFFKAIWAVVLSRYINSSDVVYGTVTNGRANTVSNAENIVGMFINTLPVRAVLADGNDFSQFVKDFQIQENSSKKYEHIPLVDIQQASASDHELFDHILIVNSFFDEAVNENTAPPHALNIEGWSAKYETTYNLVITISITTAIVIDLEYNSNVVDSELVKTLLEHVKKAITEVLRNPEKKIGQIDILTVREKEILLNQSLDTNFSRKDTDTLVSKFANHAIVNATKIAAIYEDCFFSYQFLDSLSDAIAKFLSHKQAIKEGDIVAFNITQPERTPFLLVAIAKVGGISLPLNPEDPLSRTIAIVEDANAKLLIVDKQTEKINVDTCILGIDYLFDNIFPDNGIGLDDLKTVKANDAALIYFTSGSTGRPKGVLISHQNIISFCRSYSQLFELKENRKILSFAHVSWDMATPEILGALLCGATTVLTQKRTIEKDFLAFTAVLSRHHFNIVQFTPSHIKLLLDTDAKFLVDVEYILLGGEALSYNLYQKIKKSNFKRVFNVYGPTETTTWSTFDEIKLDDEPGIGKAMPFEETFITSGDLKISPIGVPGEILIGGEGVGIGYLNLPELTHSKFISSPFREGRTLYRTGDIGRYLPSGKLEFLGRYDSQRKIHGFRIEFKEIEKTLYERDDIAETYLTTDIDQAGQEKLVLYYVAKNKLTKTTTNKVAIESKKTHSKPEILNALSAFIQQEEQRHDQGFSNTLLTQLADVCKSNPNRIAVACESSFYTFSFINKQANQLAQYLSEKVVRQRNGIFLVVLPSSDSLIPLIWAIWKIGGTYAPVDTSASIDYINEIITDTEPCCILYQAENAEFLNAHALVHQVTISVDQLFAESCKLDERTPEFSYFDNSIAYMMFTSGTSGKPKGVLIETRGMYNHLQAKISEFGVNEKSILAQNANASFDISIWQQFAGLLKGAAVRVYTKENVYAVNQFIHDIDKHGVTILELVPTYFADMMAILVSENHIDLFRSLRYNILNAEVLQASLVKKWLKLFPGCAIVNTYGATEVSDDISHYVMTTLPQSQTVPVMRKSIPGSYLMLLDEDLNLCKLEQPGEIYIGGICVAAGYLNSPELTDDRYFEFDLAGERYRFFKTNDFGKFNDNGELEFIGRIDNQLKINGQRIELEDIEYRLNGITGVKNCAVVVLKDTQPIKLIAFITLDDPKMQVDIMDNLTAVLPANIHMSSIYILENLPETSNGKIDRKALVLLCNSLYKNGLTDAIRQDLSRRLPSYMVPETIIELQSLPLTPAGKIDSKALPKIKQDKAVALMLPKSPEEKRLAVIWSDILDRESIGLLDNFFELGGHSLKAIRLVSKIFQVFGLKLDLRDIFNNPTIGGQLALMCKYSQFHDTGLNPHEECTSYPASKSQQRFWLLEEIENNGNAYMMPSAYTIKGELDASVFANAVGLLVNKYEILRTTFKHFAELGLRQIVSEACDIHYQFEYVDGFCGEDAYLHVESTIKKRCSERVNLQVGPLFKVILFKLAANEHLLFFNVHHIISDGWSTGVILDNLWQFYERLLHDHDYKPEKMRLQYKDYVNHQTIQQASGLSDKERTYWMDKLSGNLPIIDLPTVKQRPKEKSFNGNIHEFQLNKEVRDRLFQISLEYNTSIFTVLLSVTKILLSKYSGSKDIVVGTTVSGRNYSELEDQIGLFINTLVLRTNLAEHDVFSELLIEVREVVLAAYDHQHYPFDALLKDLGIARTMERSPIFDILVEYQNFEGISSHAPTNSGYNNLHVENVPLDFYRAKYDLNLIFFEDYDGSLIVSIGYNTDLFEDFQIELMGKHFEQIANSVGLNPQVNMADIPMFTDEEYKIIVDSFESSTLNRSDLVYDRIAVFAVNNPQHICLVEGSQHVTYKMLTHMVTGLSACWSRIGQLKGGAIIVVLLDRSIAMTAAILAIWKSHCVYLPIDPNYPENRVKKIIQDSKPVLLVTTRGVAAKHPAFPFNVPNVTYLDDLPSVESFEKATHIPTVAPGQDILDNAYVIYTSGSTGDPKGVLVSHAGMINHIQSKIEDLNINQETCMAQTASQMFDVSLWQFFATLCAGGKVFILSDEIIMKPAKLVDMLTKYLISVVQVVPSYLNLLLIAIDGKTQKNTLLKDLRWLVSVGEPLTTRLVTWWYKHFTHTEILNSYGPTEVSDGVTHYKVNKSLPGEKILIGSAIKNLEVFVFDANLRSCPLYVYGEIYISGIGVGNGYLNKIDKSVENFLNINGKLFYKTGDIGRYLPNGNIEFSGRVGNQVKLNGNRIELEEIENAILQNEFVKNAKILLYEYPDETKYLVAFVESNKSEALILDIKVYLEEHLPSYMIPSYYKLINHFPILSNGKIDMHALRSASFDTSSSIYNSPFVSPRDSSEQALVEAVSKLLQKNRISLLDNFFNVGGDSIKAMQLVMLLNESGFSLDIREIFRKKNLMELSKMMSAEERTEISEKKEEKAGEFDFKGLSDGDLSAMFDS